MKTVTPLVRIAHGSHLYGTSTPLSDRDYKGVHLPSGDAILLQRAEDVIECNIIAKQGTKNTSDAVDEQSFSLQKFFGMLAKGDTVATEILFADPLEAHFLWSEIQAVGRQLLNRQCKGFVGYCVRQAAKYGIKGSRMSAVKTLIDFLADKPPFARLETLAADLQLFAEVTDHSEWKNIPHPDGRECWHIVCCDRAMPMTAHIGEGYKVYLKVWENYGDRARAAMANEGVDWKAMSHAVRVAEQAIELLRTGSITFPRPNADLLLEIKQGKRPYSEVSIMLETLVEQVQLASEQSVLPHISDGTLADATVRKLYLSQIIADEQSRLLSM
jgi:hypothetical protein